QAGSATDRARRRDQSRSPSTTRASRSPSAVSRYSTCGGRVGTTTRSSTPAASNSVRRWARVRGGTEPNACANWLKRRAPLWLAYSTASDQRRPRRSAARRTSSGTGGHSAQRHITGRLSGRLERQLEHLADRHDRMEGHLLADVLGYVLEVPAVAFGQDHVGQPGCVRRQHLLLEPADRQHAALEGDLAGHPHRVLDRAAGQQGCQRGRHRDAGTRAVLGDRPGGYVDVELALVEGLLVDAEIFGVAADVGECDARGLL